MATPRKREPQLGEDGKPKPPTLVFRTCKAKCFACKECGYFWGEGAREELRGKPACWPASAGFAGGAP